MNFAAYEKVVPDYCYMLYFCQTKRSRDNVTYICWLHFLCSTSWSPHLRWVRNWKMYLCHIPQLWSLSPTVPSNNHLLTARLSSQALSKLGKSIMRWCALTGLSTGRQEWIQHPSLHHPSRNKRLTNKPLLSGLICEELFANNFLCFLVSVEF